MSADLTHVLMTADAVGGVWTFALALARALSERHVRTSLAVMGPPPSAAQRADAASIDALSVHHAPFALEWMDDPWTDVELAGEWLLDLERDLQPDIVHLNGYCHGALPWRSPVLVTGHSCVLSWWRAVHGCDAPDSSGRYAAEVTKGLAAAALVTAPSRWMLQQLQRHYGTLRRTRVIPNGRALMMHRVPQNEPFVLTAGRLWDRAKNVELLCRVAPRLSWPVYLAGSTEGPAGDAGFSSNVRYLGALGSGELTSWMLRASLYVLPARYEPFGLSALEAALCECALVLGDVPSLRAIWGDAALYVEPDDSDALEQIVRQLIDDPQRRLVMAGRAAARARRLTPRRMASSYYNAYVELSGELRPLLSLGAV
jgi:glycosyltransferase involved in cell wall biosynthesis